MRLAVTQRIYNLRLPAKGLCGYTSAVKTCSSGLALLYDDNLQAVAGGILSGPVTARTAAYDDKVCIHNTYI